MVTHKEALELATAKAWKEEIAGTRKASEVIIRAYLDARGLVMVPKAATHFMLSTGRMDQHDWSLVLLAAPDPFGDAE